MESAELVAILHEVRDRVRARNPETGAGDARLALPDLMPLVHARDAALGKVAAIGTVNPRPGGVGQLAGAGVETNACARARLACARAGGVQPQAMACIDAALEALHGGQPRAGPPSAPASPRRRIPRNELTDIRNHWPDWRVEWETKLAQNEIQFLRSVADLQAGFQHRTDLMDANYRDIVRSQHREFEGRAGTLLR